jgi:hypothetical protein
MAQCLVKHGDNTIAKFISTNVQNMLYEVYIGITIIETYESPNCLDPLSHSSPSNGKQHKFRASAILSSYILQSVSCRCNNKRIS